MIKHSLLGIILLWSHYAIATPKKTDDKQVPIPKPYVKEIIRNGNFNGKKIKYKMVAGDTFLMNKEGQPKATIFSTSYLKQNVTPAETRPITFVFNGGPGSSSVWLHMGVFGPKLIDVPSHGQGAGAPPYHIIDNSLSILDSTDLVFIDPVGTGFSKPLGGHEGKEFWGVKEDASSIAEFIRTFVTKYKRWNSPKYLAGESYGTVRAAALVKELQEGFQGIALNGVILVSAILDFQAGRFQRGNDLPFLTYLPTYAATAWFHKKTPDHIKPLETFLDEARSFASNDYLVALFKGGNLEESEEQALAEKLHRFTGLDPKYIRQTNFRVSAHRFMKQLLRDEGKTVGRFDSRYRGVDYDNAGEYFEHDASAYGITGAYVASINHYLFNNLKIDKLEEYKILNGNVGKDWNWGLKKGQKNASGYLNVAPMLAKGMIHNPDFRVFVANGYYDLATPFFSTEYALSRHGVDQSRVDMQYYKAGHMMYVHHPSLEKLAADVRKFINKPSSVRAISH